MDTNNYVIQHIPNTWFWFVAFAKSWKTCQTRFFELLLYSCHIANYIHLRQVLEWLLSCAWKRFFWISNPKENFKLTMVSENFSFKILYFCWMKNQTNIYLQYDRYISFSVSVFQSTSAKLAFRWEMRVGSCIAWSMEFSRTAKCPAIKPLEAVMTRSTPSSAKLVLENMCREQFLSI